MELSLLSFSHLGLTPSFVSQLHISIYLHIDSFDISLELSLLRISILVDIPIRNSLIR